MRSVPTAILFAGMDPGANSVTGSIPANKMAVGTERIRHRKREGAPRAFVKVAEPNAWRPRAVVAWELANGRAVPRGFVIHHVDGNPLNDDPANLACLTRAEHVRVHADAP